MRATVTGSLSFFKLACNPIFANVLWMLEGEHFTKALQIVSLTVLPTSSAESFSGDVTRERLPAEQGLAIAALPQGK